MKIELLEPACLLSAQRRLERLRNSTPAAELDLRAFSMAARLAG
jgi:hypothetical protein